MIISKYIYLTNYGFMDQKGLIVSKLHHLTVLKYLINFLVYKQKYSMKINMERGLSRP